MARGTCWQGFEQKGFKKKAEGGSLSQQRKMVSNYKQGGIAKGCGAVMENKRKITKKY